MSPNSLMVIYVDPLGNRTEMQHQASCQPACHPPTVGIEAFEGLGFRDLGFRG